MDVFISFSTKDENIAREISDVLSQNGISSWMCKSKIIGGDRWAAEITDALNDCKLFLLVLSKNSIESDQVPKEVNIALDRKVKIIPFKIDNAPLKGELYYHLSNIQYITPGFGRQKYTELVDTVNTCLNPPAVQHNSTHITNNVNNILLKNFICIPQIKLPSFLLPIIIILALLIAISFIINRTSSRQDSPDTQQVIMQSVAPPEEMTSDEPTMTSTDINAAAYAPANIIPYEVPDNPNYFHVHDGTGDGFKMGGVVYRSGFSIFSREKNAFSFNVSDKGYTKLHFKSGHVDSTGHDTQYLLIYADGEEIFRREISWETLPEECDINIGGAKKITFEVCASDYGADVGITDIVFYDSTQFTPDFTVAVEQKDFVNSPKDILPFEKSENINGCRIYNDSLKKDDNFSMGGETYTSGYTASGKCDGMLYFNVADKGFTNLSFVSGCKDGSDSVAQYISVYADGTEIFRKEIAPGDLPSPNDIDITGAKVIKIDFLCPDAGLGVMADTGLTDVVFYNSALYTPPSSQSAATITHLNSPKDIMPYKKSSTTVYNDSLKKDDYFSMGGEKYTSGYKINAKTDAKVFFNVSDKGLTNMRFVSGIVDGSDDITQYVIICADGEEIFRKEISPGDLPSADDVDITGAKSVMINIQCSDAGLGVMGDTGITDLVFYNKNEYTPK